MICVVPKGRCIGGLGNSFGLINALLHFVLISEQEVEFAIPRNICHNLGKMLGSSNHTRHISNAAPRISLECDSSQFVTPDTLCGEQKLQWGVFSDRPPGENIGPHALWCNSLSFTTEGENGMLSGGKHGNRCFPEHLTLPSRKPSPVAEGSSECDAIWHVDLKHILWHYNVSITRPKLQQLYYSSFHKTYQSPKMNILIPQDKMNTGKVIVSAHVRVGSGGAASTRFSTMGNAHNTTLRDTTVPAFREKWMSPSWVMFALSLVEDVIRPSCLKVHVFTDITHTLKDKKANTILSHPDVAPIVNAFPNTAFIGKSEIPLHMHYHSILVSHWGNLLLWTAHGSETAEGFAFQAQVMANVLIASSSGFSRLAAVLNRNTIIAPYVLSHPLHGLDNVVSAYHKDFWNRDVGGRKDLIKDSTLLKQLKMELRRSLKSQFELGGDRERLECTIWEWGVVGLFFFRQTGAFAHYCMFQFIFSARSFAAGFGCRYNQNNKEEMRTGNRLSRAKPFLLFLM